MSVVFIDSARQNVLKIGFFKYWTYVYFRKMFPCLLTVFVFKLTEG